MRKVFTAMALLMTISICNAQRNDNTWIFGYYYSALTPVCGLDFYFGTPDTVGFNPPFNFWGADVCMSDDNGDILFYSNGDAVANWNNQIIQNSMGFNAVGASYANTLEQSIIALPYPGHLQQYFLFHLCFQYSSTTLYPLRLFYSVIDMSANNGLGTMTVKKQVAFNDTLLPFTLQATKHANGRDWWIINHTAYSADFNVTLLTPSGIVQNNIISTGPYLGYPPYYAGQAKFSPDGSKYAMTYYATNSIYTFDFDRCSGVISFHDSVHIVPTDSSELPVTGCSFSPDSRYLYAITNNDLYQYDTQNALLQQAQIHIADFDGFGFPIYTDFYRQALGPDGKLYISCRSGTRYLHVINDPDMPDSACNFVQHQLLLSSYYAGVLPEFANYRLGALTGSMCDTLTGITEINNTTNHFFTVVPNPNSGEFRVNYTLKQNTSGILKVYDVLGNCLFKKTLPQWSITQYVSLTNLRSGVYAITIENGNKQFTQRFLKY